VQITRDGEQPTEIKDDLHESKDTSESIHSEDNLTVEVPKADDFTSSDTESEIQEDSTATGTSDE